MTIQELTGLYTKYNYREEDAKAVWDLGLEAKADLVDFFELNKENYRFSLKGKAEFVNEFIIRDPLIWITRGAKFNLKENTILPHGAKQELKLTRWISQNAEEIAKYTFKWPERFEYLGIPHKHPAGGSTVDFIKKQLVRFPEFMTGEVEFWVTANPYDIASCSAQGSIKSCFRPDGQYASGPWQYILHDRTMMIGKVSGKIVGRCFIHFSKDFKSYAIRKLYGNINVNELSIITDWLETKIAERLKISKEFKSVNNPKQACTDKTYAKDPFVLSRGHVSAKGWKLIIDTAPCVRCGRPMDSTSFICICAVCRG